MIKNDNDYSKLKKQIQKLFSMRVDVIQNLGRNKLLRYSGVVTGVYPALFTVLPDIPKYNGKTSFSYSEIMCGSVKIKEKV